MPNTSPIILLLPRQTDLSAELGLPETGDNLFQRIIRNPHVDARNPRERECTEMLCAVFRNTSIIQFHLLQWMAGHLEVNFEGIGSLRFEFETESLVGNKRIDLCIEGWRDTDEGRQRILLWTVEVKVGASFHSSAPLEGVCTPDDNEGDVNQLANYDHWLNNQQVKNRAGFVLALEEMSDLLPSSLKCRWRCSSWTKLGLKIQDVLLTEDLPDNEIFLAKHLLGFITNHLWRDSEMSEFELGFDDVALIRAFNAIGHDCEDKINQQVDSLKSLILQSGIGFGEPTHQKSLYRGHRRSVIYRDLFDPSHNRYPTLMAGVEGAQLSVWLESSPSFEKKEIIDSIVHSRLPKLRERNPNWKVHYQWCDLELAMPLANLLAAENQANEFEKFFKLALEDMQETGLIQLLREGLAT